MFRVLKWDVIDVESCVRIVGTCLCVGTGIHVLYRNGAEILVIWPSLLGIFSVVFAIWVIIFSTLSACTSLRNAKRIRFRFS